MIKTQVQLPDHIYAEAKRIAKEYEMSFAAVVCRGIEKMASANPPHKKTARKWQVPTPRALGFRGLSDSELKDAAQENTFAQQLIGDKRKIHRD